MGSLAVAGGIGATILRFALTFAISLIPNSVAMWVVVKMEMGEKGADASFWNCFLCVLLLSVFGAFMSTVYILSMIFLPMVTAIGGWLLLLAWAAGSKAIIEGMFEITDGSGTILILYVAFFFSIKYLVVPAILGEEASIEPEDPFSGPSMMGSSGALGIGSGSSMGSYTPPKDERKVKELSGHSGTINDIAFLTDGKRAVSAAEDGHIILWDLDSATQIRRFSGHANAVNDIDLTDDGTRMVSGSSDGSIRVWDVETGNQLTELRGHTGDVLAVAIHPDGQVVAAGDRNRQVRLWDLASGQFIPYDGHTEAIAAVDFTPDGFLVMTASKDGWVNILDFSGGREVMKVQVGSVGDALFCPDRRHIVVGDINGTIYWIDTGQQKVVQQFRAHEAAIVSVAVAPDMSTYTTADVDWGDTLVWGAFKNGEADQEKQELDAYSVSALAYSPDSMFVLTGDEYSDIVLWDLTKPAPQRPSLSFP